MKLLPHLPSPSPASSAARVTTRAVSRVTDNFLGARGDVATCVTLHVIIFLQNYGEHAGSRHTEQGQCHTPQAGLISYIAVPGLRATALYTLFFYYLVCFNPLIDYFNILSTNYGYNSGLSFTKCKGTPIYFKNLIYYNEERPCKVIRSLQSHLKKERRILTLTTHNSRLISQEAGQGDLRCIRRFQEDKRSYKCYDLDESRNV